MVKYKVVMSVGVKGGILKDTIVYLRSKKGINGIKEFLRYVNSERTWLFKVEDIKSSSDYSVDEFVDVLKATAKVLGGDILLTVEEIGSAVASRTMFSLTAKFLTKGLVLTRVVEQPSNKLNFVKVDMERLSSNTHVIVITSGEPILARFSLGYIIYLLEQVKNKVEIKNIERGDGSVKIFVKL